MVETMTNGDLISHTISDDGATDREIELADRLSRAIEEIENLVQTITTLRAAADGKDTGR